MKHPPLPTSSFKTSTGRENKSLASSPTLRPVGGGSDPTLHPLALPSSALSPLSPLDAATPADSPVTRPLLAAVAAAGSHHPYAPSSTASTSALLNATAAAHSPALLGKHLYDVEHRLPGSVPWLSLPGAIGTPTPTGPHSQHPPPVITTTECSKANSSGDSSAATGLPGKTATDKGGRRRSDGGHMGAFSSNQMAPNQSSQHPHSTATPTSLLAAATAAAAAAAAAAGRPAKISTPLPHHHHLIHHQDLAVMSPVMGSGQGIPSGESNAVAARTGSPMTTAFGDAVHLPPFLRTSRAGAEALQTMERSFSNPGYGAGGNGTRGGGNGLVHTAPVSPFLLPKVTSHDVHQLERTSSGAGFAGGGHSHTHHQHLPLHGSSKLAGGSSSSAAAHGMDTVASSHGMAGASVAAPTAATPATAASVVAAVAAVGQSPSTFFRSGTPLANLPLPHLTSPPKLHPSFGTTGAGHSGTSPSTAGVSSTGGSSGSVFNPYFDIHPFDHSTADTHTQAPPPSGASKA
ncbi:hypothetical protein BGW42_004192 [Actinomortierella wolfii]|nr:hypothetical protein BGW42_004192 [Actinomortierella wolfii]